MSIDLIVFLLVFCAPGALAVEAWDWGCHRTDRSFPSLIGHGVLLSIVVYAIVGLLPGVEISRLFDTSNALSMDELLDWRHMLTFLVLCVLMLIAGFAAGLYLHPWLQGRLGRSFYSFAWTDAFNAAMRSDRTAIDEAKKVGRKLMREERSWVIVKTKSQGTKWIGLPHFVPPHPNAGDFVALLQPSQWIPGSGEADEGRWEECADPLLLVPVADIEYMTVTYKEAIDAWRRQDNHEAGAGSTANSGPPHRLLGRSGPVQSEAPAPEASQVGEEGIRPAGQE